MAKFYIRDGCKIVPTTLEEWNEWHLKLNRKRDNTRTIDQHVFSQGKYRMGVTTLFTGGPDAIYLTFATGHPGLSIYSNELGVAKICHHEVLQEVIASGWRLDPSYSPTEEQE